MLKPVVTFIILLIVGVTPGHSEELRDASLFFHDSFGDLQEEAALAIEEGKTGALVMFETDDCPWCKRMKERVLNRARVQDFYHENFRVIAIDAEGGTMIVNFDGTEIMEVDFALKYNRVRATPVFAFFNTDGEFLTRYTGAAKTVEEFLLLGDFVVTEAYKNSRFSKYKREHLKRAG